MWVERQTGGGALDLGVAHVAAFGHDVLVIATSTTLLTGRPEAGDGTS